MRIPALWGAGARAPKPYRRDVLRLRAATEADLPLLVELRNDPASVRFSKRGALSAGAVARDYLGRSDKHAYVVERAGVPVGYAVFETLGGDRGEISIALAPALRGQGLARPLIETASLRAAELHGFEVILAEIDVANTPSRRAFRAAGYRLADAAPGESGLERYELRVASPRSAVARRDPARGPAPPPRAPPPRD